MNDPDPPNPPLGGERPLESVTPDAAGLPAPAPRAQPDDTASALARIEHLLSEIRGCLDALERERRHRPFSPWRTVGAVLQVAAAGLTILVVMDWVFQRPPAPLFTKAALALILQLGALTALLVSDRQ